MADSFRVPALLLAAAALGVVVAVSVALIAIAVGVGWTVERLLLAVQVSPRQPSRTPPAAARPVAASPRVSIH